MTRRRATAALLSARVVSAASTLVVLAVLARLRGLDALGIGALGAVAGTIMGVAADFGTNSLATREIARDRSASGPFLGAIIVSRVVFLPLLIGVAVPVFGMAFGASGGLVLLFALSFVFQQEAELGRAVLLGTGRPYVVAAHGVIENAAWAVVIVAALAAGAELYLVEWLGLACMVASTVAGAVLIVRWGVMPAVPATSDWRRLARLAPPFAALSLLVILALRVDTLLVGLVVPSGIAAAGAYFAASRLISSTEYLPEAMGRAVYPDLSRGAVEAPDRFREALRPAIRDLLALSIPVPVALLVGGWAVLPILFGSELAPYSWIMLVLGFAVPARFAVVLFGVALASADRQTWRALITGVALVVGQGLDLLLLPQIGVPAAVIASVLTTLMLLVPYAREIRSRFGLPSRPADVLVPLACSAVAAIPAIAIRAVFGFGDGPAVITVTLAVFAAVYFGSLMAAGAHAPRGVPA